MTDPLRECLIARLVSGPPTFRYVPGDDTVKIVADDLADAMLEIVAAELGRLRAAAECVDPVYRDHTRFDLEKELRQATSDHRDLYLDMQRRTAERDEARAELARLRRIENAARAVVESKHQYIHNSNYSQVTMTGYEPLAVSRSALDALAAEVARADGGEKR